MAIATASGTFSIGGDLEVPRLGFGAMRITGRGIWGPPPDRDAALAVLRRLPELGVDFIDTADSYGPFVSEDLIHEALHPYDGITVATKGGLTRTGPGEWPPVGRPEYLRQCCEMSLRRLGLDEIPLYQLHRIDPGVPRAAGKLAQPGGAVAAAAEAHDATPGQVALAWLLQRSPVMLPIPGTGSVEHLQENVAAAELELTPEEVERLDAAA